MDHGHGPGGNSPEIHALAKALFQGGSPLAQISQCSLEGRNVRASFESREPITKAELSYTTDTGRWVDRHWQTRPAELDVSGGMTTATLPAATTVCYLNLFDAQDCVVSSEHLVL
ncbi:MAG: hypothetical protein H2172_06180 [Opitutus sp.]|nr:hypothetical protein [Opitutus sp.]MCS6247028.1 hypothetical protein [Opitutus sp.]MCS6278625.1 hypothetical protein [Opitutus sp.]MCS6298496.1 hypothetical protein [Opitutus sp.]